MSVIVMAFLSMVAAFIALLLGSILLVTYISRYKKMRILASIFSNSHNTHRKKIDQALRELQYRILECLVGTGVMALLLMLVTLGLNKLLNDLTIM